MLTHAKVDKEKVDRCFPVQVNGQPDYYRGQRETIIQIIAAFEAGNVIVIANCPTGTGKSLIADTIRKYYGGRALGITPKNVLVEQYRSLGWRVLKGASNYDCITYPPMNCSEGMLHAKIMAPIKKKGDDLPGCCPQCPYTVAAMAAFCSENDGLITNPHFVWAFFEDFVIISDRKPIPFLVIDEAHLLESTLAEVIQVVVSQEFVQEMGFETKLEDTLQIDQWLQELMKFLAKAKEEVIIGLKELKPDDSLYKEQAAKLIRMTGTESAINIYFDNATHTHWLKQLNRDSKGKFISIVLDPVYGGFMAEKIFALSNRILLMSATMLDKRHCCDELKINENDCAYIDVPNSYPAQNQPFLLDDELKLNYRSTAELLPKLVAKIDCILDKYEGQRGIIHTVSHKLAASIYKSSRHRSRMTYSKKIKQSELVEMHEQKEDSVLVGPAWIEGLDLKDTLGTFCIIAKVPFLPLQINKKLKIREADHPGYASMQTVRKIIQAKGRVIRGPEEKADTFCLDGNLNLLLRKASEFFPDSFLDTLQYFKISTKSIEKPKTVTTVNPENIRE